MIRRAGAKTALRRNTAAATVAICVGIFCAYIVLPPEDPKTVFRIGAIIVGTVLTVALFLESRSGFRALLRADILMLIALYGLTFLEFLLPQPDLSGILTSESAVRGTEAVLLAFAGIALGRHLVPLRATALSKISNPSPTVLFRLFLFCSAIGYLHMFLAVNFDVVEVVRQMTYPRFSQAWTRPQFGDWHALLNELGLLIYLLPPIAGLVLARREQFKVFQKLIVSIILVFTLFYGFSSGTRNLFMIFLLTFASAYLIFRRNLRRWQIAISVGVVILATLIGTYLMLEFRTVGLAEFNVAQSESATLFVDNNILVISKLTEVFPDRTAFLGMEVPFQAITKPVPRALWPGKPEGLSFGTEEVVGATATTISSTFIGESYMAGGFLGITIASFLLGAMAGWWNRLRYDLDSDFKLLLYVSGFFAAALSMRSILHVVPAFLPTLALWIYGKVWVPARKRKVLARRVVPVGVRVR
jgi:oligosaccharide repeat unit polymerase